MLKFGKECVDKATPTKIRKLANALMSVSTFANGIAVFSGHPVTAVIFASVGLLGKFLSEYFAEDVSPQANP